MTRPDPADHDPKPATTDSSLWGRSGTTSIPPGQPVPACPYPCATCRTNGRQ
ncbi:hypothetical protein SALB_05826 [Streptomyces noursei]|uniref:Uncharacterized protein n=1 Tax=Streptomyces noursei TaxID=1971 RepID=A0A401R611_STRNR|nr:hypothetical protein SALB_05826 [Streptomyces noursei]